MQHFYDEILVSGASQILRSFVLGCSRDLMVVAILEDLGLHRGPFSSPFSQIHGFRCKIGVLKLRLDECAFWETSWERPAAWTGLVQLCRFCSCTEET